jgi:hypothetical protein
MTIWASSDSHLVEPAAIFQEHASQRWKRVAPRLVSSEQHGDVFVLEGISLALPLNEIIGGSPCGFNDVPEAAYRPATRLRQLDQDGVSAELLFPTLGLFLEQHPDRQYFQEFAWAYNRWLASEWVFTPRLQPLMMLGSGQSAKEKRTAISFAVENGMRGILLPSAPTNGCWADDEHQEFFADLAAADLLVAYHAFSRPIRPHMLRKAAALFTASHEAMDIFTELVTGRVLLRHPGLRVIVGEGQSWWLGEWMRRLTEEEGITAAELDTFATQLRVTDTTYPENGGDFVGWASDFPHGLRRGDSEPPHDSEPSSFRDGTFWLTRRDLSRCGDDQAGKADA